MVPVGSFSTNLLPAGTSMSLDSFSCLRVVAVVSTPPITLPESTRAAPTVNLAGPANASTRSTTVALPSSAVLENHVVCDEATPLPSGIASLSVGHILDSFGRIDVVK